MSKTIDDELIEIAEGLVNWSTDFVMGDVEDYTHIVHPSIPTVPLAKAKERLKALIARERQEAEDQLISSLEAYLGRLHSRNWTVETLVLDTFATIGKATADQIKKRDQIVIDRRVALSLSIILTNYKEAHTKLAKEQS